MTEDIQFEDDVVALNELPEGFAKQSQIVDSLSQADGLLVVDVSNLAWRANFAYDLTTKDGRRSGHVYGSLRLLLTGVKNYVAAGKWCVVFCYDGQESKKLRRAILPDYKINRDPNRFNPCPEVREVLRLLPGIHVEHPEREGDDAIAWAVGKMRSDKRHTVILSSDKDVWALTATPGVKVYSPNKKAYITPEHIEEEYGLYCPEAIYLAKALFGDPSDCIKGIPRLLKKQVVPHLNASRGQPNVFLAELDAASKEVTSLKTQMKIREGWSAVEANLKAIRPMVEGFDQSNVVKQPISDPNKERFTAAVTSYECNSLVTSISYFFGAPFYVGGQE